MKWILIIIVVGMLFLGVPFVFAKNSPGSPKSARWTTYEANNGTRFRVNMANTNSTAIGVYVMVQEIGVDPVPQVMIFNCRGYYLLPGDGDTEWILAPPRSVAGVIAKDVCAKR
jgi:hypothetical protein